MKGWAFFCFYVYKVKNKKQPYSFLKQRDLRAGGGGQGVVQKAYLFEEAVNAAFIASLEQGGDGQGGNAAVLVGDQALHVNVAVGDGHGVGHCHVVQCAHSCKPACAHSAVAHLNILAVSLKSHREHKTHCRQLIQ